MVRAGLEHFSVASSMYWQRFFFSPPRRLHPLSVETNEKLRTDRMRRSSVFSACKPYASNGTASMRSLPAKSSRCSSTGMAVLAAMACLMLATDGSARSERRIGVSHHLATAAKGLTDGQGLAAEASDEDLHAWDGG
jgi:hypothetical protein